MSETTEYETTGSASVHIDASPAAAYAFLTDLERLPTLSPENQRCEFLNDETALAVDVVFRGYNENQGYEWHADCKVTVLEADTAFAYEVPPKFEHATIWRYDIVADNDGDGCTVTESFDAPMLAIPEVYPGKIEGRCDDLRKACETTMANLKAALEG